jgi:hypothetical protein
MNDERFVITIVCKSASKSAVEMALETKMAFRVLPSFMRYAMENCEEYSATVRYALPLADGQFAVRAEVLCENIH